MWNWCVDAIRVAIFTAAHLCNGSLGGGVLVVSFAVRLALLALSTRLAQRAAPRQQRLVALAQLPFLAGLFAAVRSGLGAGVRFLWIADLARPDRALVLIVAGIAGTAASLAPAPTTQQAATTAAALVAVIASIAFLWSASGAIALSWGAGSVVSGLQSWLLRREEPGAGRAQK